MDYSFLRLKPNFAEAIDTSNTPVAKVVSNDFIVLNPYKNYTQITNVDGGISFNALFDCYVVDCNNNVLTDITDKVFTEEFIDNKGQNQIAIEFVSLGVDYFKQPVFIRFDIKNSNSVWWSNPITITDYESEKQAYFKYKSYDDFFGIGYTNGNKWQSISINLYFDAPIDKSEAEDYFQISKDKTITTRVLNKLFEKYKVDFIDRFTFDRLNVLLRHDLVYLNGIRLTNKPIVESNENNGNTNWFSTDFEVSKDYSDVSDYELQIATPLAVLEFTPFGAYLPATNLNEIKIVFNQRVEINKGNIRLFDNTASLVANYDVQNFTLSTTTITNDTISLTTSLPNVNNYYFYVDADIVVSPFGVFDKIINSTTWFYVISDADFLNTDFNNNDFLTN